MRILLTLLVLVPMSLAAQKIPTSTFDWYQDINTDLIEPYEFAEKWWAGDDMYQSMEFKEFTLNAKYIYGTKLAKISYVTDKEETYNKLVDLLKEEYKENKAGVFVHKGKCGSIYATPRYVENAGVYAIEFDVSNAKLEILPANANDIFKEYIMEDDMDLIAVEEPEPEPVEEEVFMIVDKMPALGKCDELERKERGQCTSDKVAEHISKKIKYPKSAKDAGVQGTTYVQFVVDTDGSAIEYRVLRGFHTECDEEALRAVKTLPKFTPGTQRGRAVKVYYTVPLMFSL